MAHPVQISLQSLRSVCNSLESLLAKSFGPNALQVLYTTSSGKVLLTSDGSTILHALHVSHPIGRWLIDRAGAFHRQTGDHAKTFVMLLADILYFTSHELGHITHCEGREQIINLCKGFLFVLQEVFPLRVLPALLAKSEGITQETPDETVCVLGRRLILTQLAGKLSPKLARFMSRLLWDFLTGYVGKPLHMSQNGTDLLSDLWDNYGEIAYEVVGLPTESSHIEDGLILSRIPVCLPARSAAVDSPCRFIMFGFDPSKLAVSSSAVIATSNVEGLLDSMRCTRLMIVRVVDVLMRLNVGVLLCSECLPVGFISLLQQASITVIHTIPIEELQRLSNAANVDILYEMPVEMDSAVTCLAQEVNQVTFGSKRGTQFVLGNGSAGANHLVLCAPSEGMCRTLSQAARDAIKCIQTWLNSSINPAQYHARKCESLSGLLSHTAGRSEKSGASLRDRKGECVQFGEQSGDPRETRSESFGWVISGGGAAELIANDILDLELTQQKDNWKHLTALKIISSALLGIPRRIYRQSFAAKSEGNHSFVKIVNQMRSTVSPVGQHALGINGKTGELCIPMDIGVIESLSGKYCLWLSVVETVIDLLKMDQIVPVQKILREIGTLSDDDDDEN